MVVHGSLDVADGRTYAGHRDPPGQSSVYITPGDHWKENYRLFTFARFPESSAVYPTELAAAGFYYTGFSDRVKCFNCGLSVENWTLHDNPKDKRWHKSDCDFINGRPTNNEPLLGKFTRFFNASSRDVTRQNVGATSSRFTPQNTPNIAHQHQNGNSRVQTSTSTNDIRTSESHSHNTPQRTQSPSTSGNYSRPSQPIAQETSHIPGNITQETRNELYPCNAPVNPHMASVIARLETFKPAPGLRWPREKLKATIDELVNAGFFYLGERDRVKCWYCNGGLQNWDYEDEPIVEHAKWFPSCEYVLRIKGPTFVENIVAEFPDIDRPAPTIRTTPRLPPTGHPRTPPSPMDIPPQLSPRPQPVVRSRTPTPPIENHAPILSTNEAVERAMEELAYVKQAREMGFEIEAIKTVLRRKYETNNQFYNTGEEFMEALFGSTLENRDEVPNPHNGQNASATLQLTSGTSSLSLEENFTNNSTTATELRKLEETRTCKVCRSRPSNIVIVPCGHLAVCDDCVRHLKKCPICARNIQDKIKTFRA